MTGRAFFNSKNKMERYEYVTATLTMDKTQMVAEVNVTIPDGTVTNLGIVQSGNNEGRIINFSVLENNNTLLQPADLKFSERTGGSSYKDSLRPVELDGGRILQVRLTTMMPSLNSEDVTVQVLFMIRRPNSGLR